MPANRTLLLSDYQILDLISQGWGFTKIANAHHVSAEAVRWRVGQIKKNIAAPAARRASEVVDHAHSAMEALSRSITVLNALREACLAQLEGQDGNIDIGPHDFDCEVVVSLNGAPPQRRSLSSLLQQSDDTLLLAIDSKHEDPRKLLLATIGQIRQHIELAVRLYERVHNADSLARFQETVLTVIESADKETAARIRQGLRDRQELRLALQPPTNTQP